MPMLLVGAILTGGDGGGFTILIVKDDQEPIFAQTKLLSTAMYLVRTVWALMRFNNDTLIPLRIKHEAFPALAVFLEGLEMIGIGFESMSAVGFIAFLFKKT